jgi:hypothetical protein
MPLIDIGDLLYDVVATGELLGRICRTIFDEATDEPHSPTHTYDGKVYPNSNGAELALNISGEVGRITGLVIDDARCIAVQAGRDRTGHQWHHL